MGWGKESHVERRTGDPSFGLWSSVVGSRSSALLRGSSSKTARAIQIWHTPINRI